VNRDRLATVLLNHNATLETMPMATNDSQSESGQQIAYFTKLNYYGRSVARKSSTNLSDFVGCLSTAAALKTHFEDRNVIYGLLREMPTLWSGAKQKKRKRKSAAR
jgi:hypothetical protein